ncbi:winged helix-turn-helix transcriptional regulator [Nocardia araoensis]|uniref:winged helix-turn-helix transcriptional regulator n=1 Tax=Nocardia araoensis TaxID=228600 RepID=UPI0002DA9DBD|nr:helix-turn-helix domain-containing protein [Nocardia araoensis]
MEGRRGYGEGCAVAHGLELIGERWTLLIVRELLLGPKRFNVLRSGLLQANSNALSLRLKLMEQDGLVQHRKLGAPTNAWVWGLTDWGYELEPIILAIGGWARSSPMLDQDGWFSPDALILHLKARFSSGALPPAGRYRVRIADDVYSIVVVDGSAIRVERSEPCDPDVTIDSELSTLTAVIKHREPFADALGDGRLAIQGDRNAAERLLTGH